MCGIAGIIRVTPPDAAEVHRRAIARPHTDAIPEAWLDLLDKSIRQRGPDGQGRFRDRAVRDDGAIVDVALIHRRMSIIDHACGAQPMVSATRNARVRTSAASVPSPHEDGRVAAPPALLFHGQPSDAVEYRAVREGADDLVATVFNGCIYNHRELRTQLAAAGHEFITDHSDTEVLIHGWREWGVGTFDRLNAMLAAVVWDRAAGSVALARDPMGEKPLFLYHVYRDRSWFNVFASVPPESSMMRALGRSGMSAPAAASVAQWLRFGYAQTSPVADTRTVAPGTVVLYQRAAGPLSGGSDPAADTAQLLPSAHAYGPLAEDGQLVTPDRTQMLDERELDRLIGRSVALRLEADVPLGCFLSGGIDSSLVAHFARAHLGALRTFTVRMPHPGFDESAFAAEVAGGIGTQHETLECDARPAEDLVQLVRELGAPLGDSSLLPAFWVSRAARRHVKVVLGGDGGDELFFGYDRYAAAGRTPSGLPGIAGAARLVGWGAGPQTLRSRTARLLDAAGHAGYWDVISIFPTSLLHQLLADRAAIEEDAQYYVHQPVHWSAGFAAMMDLCNYLPFDLLRKMDTASMSVALEVRSPLLDPNVADAALRAEIEALLPAGQRKGLLRQVARKYLPAEIVDRPKQGFAIPIGEWFRTDYGGMKTLLLDRLNMREPFGPAALGIDLNRRFIQQMVDEHMACKRDHSQRLYMLLVLSLWTDSLEA